MQATGRQPQRTPDGAPVHYERHRPEQTTLYRLVQQHAASFIAHTEASTGSALPRFIKDEFDAFLGCGILAHGFLRLRCNIHLHCLVLDGVYRCGADGAPVFVEVGAPTDDELHALLQTVITRLLKMLMRRGVLIEEMGQTYVADPDIDGEEARALRPLQAAAATYRIAFGPRAGHKVLTLRGAIVAREAAPRQSLCADIDGFSLHAAVRVNAHDRKRLEQLCRYITRPALSDKRVQLNAAGQVELKLKTPWRDGTTVPQGPAAAEQVAEAAAASECEAETIPGRPHRIGWARLHKRVFDIDMQHSTARTAAPGSSSSSPPSWSGR